MEKPIIIGLLAEVHVKGGAEHPKAGLFGYILSLDEHGIAINESETRTRTFIPWRELQIIRMCQKDEDKSRFIQEAKSRARLQP